MAEIDGILSELRQTPKTFAKNQIIFEEGAPADGFYRVLHGCVRLLTDSREGTKQIVRFVIAGELLGIAPVIRATTAEASSMTELLHYMLPPCRNSIQLTYSLIDIASNSYNELAHHIKRIIHRRSEDRIELFYADLRKRNIIYGNPPDSVPMSQLDIANYLGMSPEQLCRCSAKLHKKIIVPRRKRIEAGVRTTRDAETLQHNQ